MDYLIILLAISALCWLCWQLLRAKQYNRFIRYINQQLKPLVAEHLIQQLEQQRCDLTPNNESHIQACLYYWQQYPVRTLQYAIKHELITMQQLQALGYQRALQHLLFVQQQWRVY